MNGNEAEKKKTTTTIMTDTPDNSIAVTTAEKEGSTNRTDGDGNGSKVDDDGPSSSPHHGIVPQLATHGITFDELQIAVRVLNAVASLAPNNNNNKKRTKKNNEKGRDESSSKKRSRPLDDDDDHNNEYDDNDDDNNDTDENDDGTELVAYKDSNLRPFRKALVGCLSLHQQTMFDGIGTDKYLQHRDEIRSMKRRKMAEQDQQRRHLANTALRRGRIERLKEKQNEGRDEEVEKLSHVQKLMIPDGHVETTTTTNNNGGRHLLEGPCMEQGDDAAVTNGDGNILPQQQHQPQQHEEEGTGIKLPKLRSCYVCKARFRDLHHFYDQLCPPCATLNWEKRHQTTDLRGKVAVVTGSRVKIGYQTCLKLLRAGASVVATTRFPNAAVHSYRQEPDFDQWKDRLQVYGLDLRDVTGIEAFCRFLKMKLSDVGLDILINNACQTVRRPRAYYLPACEREEQLWKEADDTHRTLLSGCLEFERIRRQLLLEHKHGQTQGLTSPSRNEVRVLTEPSSSHATNDVSLEDSTHEPNAAFDGLDEAIMTTTAIATRRVAENTTSGTVPFESTGMSHSAAASQMILLPEDVGVSDAVLPRGATDINGQQLDLRTTNSWLLKMDQVSTPEVMECMFINAIAPFVLNSRLKPLMCMPPTHDDRYVVNVSAMEGKFYRYKMPTHPHTNMAKASLNMMTRTAAEDLAKNHGIYMNSIDTGWINDENPLERASKTAEVNNFQTPIDEIDAAARIVDPIFSHSREYGKFLKDYRETEW